MSQWEVRISESRGVPYFYNSGTNQSSWTAPSELTEEQANALLGAAGGQESSAKAEKVRASHILVKHNRSRRPSSWKEPNITRSKDEAIELLRGYQVQIDGSADKDHKFGKVASAHSDDSSHSKQGDLGWFGRGQMQKPFEEAAFGLKVGEISGIVSTDSGVHLVMRTG